jgi:hypothetical protein
MDIMLTHKCWYQDDKLHRVDGPAMEWSDGDRAWYQDGRLHRVDGPAVELYGESRGIRMACATV